MGRGHPECPERLDAIEDRLLITGVGDALDRREAPSASLVDVELAHGRMHVASLRGLSDSLSIADLTLIASTPSHQVAASTRGSAPAASTPTQAAGAGSAEHGEKPDVDKIAAEVYGEILKLLEVARERSGDPWL